MNATQWQRLQQMVSGASELPVLERQAYLNQCCDGDGELRREAEELLASFSLTGDFFENAIAGAARHVGRGAELNDGDKIGPYRITGTIGHGGMGTVYCAERSDRQFRQSVAVKLVRTGPGTNQELFARFRAERQILANINHPNIARLLDGGITEAGLPYLVMEFVEGLTLDRYIAAHTLNVAERLTLFQQICAAIQHAHQNLVVHRDLKPGNIMVTADGTPKLLDFGIAKLLSPDASLDTVIYTRPAERLMTPEYASPEQIRGGPITTATDIYGLGVLLYELLTGSRPFQLANLSYHEVEKLICETQPRPPSFVGLQTVRTTTRKQTDLDRIVLKALHKAPERRYASAADLSSDIARYLGGFPVTARPDSFGYRTCKFIGRHGLAVSAAVLFLATVTGLSINLAVQRNRARHEAASAEAVSQYLVGLFDLNQPDATQGRSVSARELLDQGTERLTKEWRGDPSVKARLLKSLGTVYYQLGALDRGATLLSEAETIYTNATGPNSLEVAQTASHLGDILEDKGNYDRALEQYTKALGIYEKKKGHNSTEVADALDSIGGLRWTFGDYQASEQLRQEAIRIETLLLGPEAKQTLTSKGNLEAVFADEGDYKDAEPLVREVLRERTRLNGLYNSSVASALNNLAFILIKTGRFHEADAVLGQALAVRRRLYSGEHPELGFSAVMTGWLYLERGQFELAKQFVEQGLGIATRTEGLDSLDTAFDEDALGLVLILMNDPVAARPWVEKALATRLAGSTQSQPLLSQSYDHLGLIDLEEGKLQPAREQIERALKMRLGFYKRENDWVASSYNHLGRVLYASGEVASALEAYKRALKIARQNFGQTNHPITAEALYGQGRILLEQHQLAQAAPLLGESLRMRQALLIPTHPDLLASKRALAEWTRAQAAAH